MKSENLQRWNFYMKDMSSPQSFIDFGFYSIIGAALQRRVWCGPKQAALYPNTYAILVGDPGLGKGLVIKQMLSLLRFHRMKPRSNTITEEEIFDDPQAAAIHVQNMLLGIKDKNPESPLLIPMAAEASTYEALIRHMARSARAHPYKEYDTIQEKYLTKNYVHTSLSFCLEEISSLFRKKTEDLVNFLITAYDCGDYTYDTKNQGTDAIKRCCLNFFGGTTPNFVGRVFGDALLNEGFASRCWFIHEYKSRFNRFDIPEFSPEQLIAYHHLAEHILKLSKLYGQVKFTEEAKEFLRHWWEQIHPYKRPNSSPKLLHYYTRKNIHVPKLAMIGHFMDNTDMTVNLEECQWALNTLDAVERNMHFALAFDTRNPLQNVARNVVKFLTAAGPQRLEVVLMEFYNSCTQMELDEVINYLLKTRQIENIGGKFGVPGYGSSPT